MMPGLTGLQAVCYGGLLLVYRMGPPGVARLLPECSTNRREI